MAVNRSNGEPWAPDEHPVWLVRWDDWTWWRMDNSEATEWAYARYIASPGAFAIFDSYVDYGGQWGVVETVIDFDEMTVRPRVRGEGPKRRIVRVIVPQNQPHAEALLHRPANEEDPPSIHGSSEAEELPAVPEDDMEQEL